MFNKKISSATLISEMDHNVKRMLKLIEDGDSFAKKDEMCYEKRHALLSLVKDFSLMYRSLAERHDNNIADDIQSQSSCISEVGSELPSVCPSPDQPPNRLGSGDESSSSLDFESEFDASSVVNDDDPVLRRKMYELEVEPRGAKEKLRMHYQENSSECSSTGSKNGNIEVFRPYETAYEEEIRLSEDVKKLTTQLSTRKYMKVLVEEEVERTDICLEVAEQQETRDKIGIEQEVPVHPEEEVDRRDTCLEVAEKQESRDGNGIEQKVPPLEEELSKVKFKLHDSEKEIVGLRETLKKTQASELILQDQLMTMTAYATFLKGKLDKEEREVLKLRDRITKYKTNLSDSDEEIRRLKEAITIANKSLSDETMIKLQKERSYLENNLKELDARCKLLEEDLRRALARKAEIKTSLGVEIERLKTMVTEKDDQVEELTKSLGAITRNRNMQLEERAKVGAKVEELTAEMSSKDDWIDAMCQHLNQLQTEQVKLRSEIEGEHKMTEELRSTANELETKIKQQQEMVEEGAEEKREAIRQLSMSLDHYRVGYIWLRDVVVNHKRSPES